MPILNWLTRGEDILTASRVPYRLLEEAPDLSAGDSDAGNMLIQGDNLEAFPAARRVSIPGILMLFVHLSYSPSNKGATRWNCTNSSLK